MKTRHLLLIFIICFIMSLFSCQKELTNNDGAVTRVDSIGIGTGGGNAAGVDSNYLDKIIVVDSNAVGIDSGYYLFNYDNLKRIKNIDIKSFNTTGNNFDTAVINFYYNANDTLPYKVLTTIELGQYYFTYNNAGKLIKDSVIQRDPSNPVTNYSIRVNNYSFGNNEIYVNSNKAVYIANVSLYNFNDTLRLDAFGNVTMANYYSNASGIMYFSQNVTASFDNKISPYKKVKGWSVFLFSYNDYSDGFSIGFPSINNPVVIAKTNYTGNTVTQNFVNSYYPNGFLKRYKMTNSNGFTEEQRFFYKAL